MSRIRARALFDNGITSAELLATAQTAEVINICRQCNAWKKPYRAIKGAAAEKADFIEQKVAKSMIRRAGLYVETLKTSTTLARQSEIEMSQERRKARAERDAKKRK